jgi:nucleoside-diphosphate-sugar epimerase
MKRQANKSKKPRTNSVIVTGAAGFIGSHLCEYFLDQGFFVVGIDNFRTGSRKNIHFLKKIASNQTLQSFEFFQHDVSRPWPLGKLRTILLRNKTSMKYLFHFASPASPPLYQKFALETLDVNSKGTENALKVADLFKARLVFASTSEVYGDPEVHPQPESYWGHVNPCGVRSCYDEAKRFGESLIFTHNLKNKTRHGWVRIFNTYGPRMNPTDGRVVINFLVQALKNQDLTIYGDGTQTRSFCFISDLVSGIVAYAQKDLTIPVNLGNPTEFNIRELASTIQKMESFQGSKIVFKDAAIDDPKKRKPDIQLAKKELSWEPKISLELGLKQTLDWLKIELKQKNSHA